MWQTENVNVEIASVKFFKQYVILKFKEFDNINDIEQYVKKDLCVTRENAVKCEPGEYFICDLIGLDVITDEGEHIGKLTDVLETEQIMYMKLLLIMVRQYLFR